MRVLSKNEKREFQEDFEDLLNRYEFTNGIFVASDIPLHSTEAKYSFYVGSTPIVNELLHRALVNVKLSLGIVGKDLM